MAARRRAAAPGAATEIDRRIMLFIPRTARQSRSRPRPPRPPWLAGRPPRCRARRCARARAWRRRRTAAPPPPRREQLQRRVRRGRVQARAVAPHAVLAPAMRAVRADAAPRRALDVRAVRVHDDRRAGWERAPHPTVRP